MKHLFPEAKRCYTWGVLVCCTTFYQNAQRKNFYMAASKALTAIVREAKSLKRKHPHRFDHLKKSTRWSKGYIKQASAIYAKKHHGSSPVGKKKKKKVGAKRKTHRKISARPKGKKLVRYVEKTSTERVMGKKNKRRYRRVAVRMAGRRRRSVGQSEGGGSTKLLLGLAIGAGLIYLFTKKSAPATTYPTNLPALATTSNYTRNSQSQDIVNYALAAGLAVDAIANLINKLNSSNDSEVTYIYDKVNTTGDLSDIA